MHKKIILLFIVLLSLSVHVHAQFTSTPTFVSTVKSIRSMWDGSVVVLEGYFIKQLEDTVYIFEDSTDSIKVKIEYPDFEFLSVDSKTKVKLRGEVDVLWPSKFRRINVDYVEIIALESIDADANTEKEENCVCDD